MTFHKITYKVFQCKVCGKIYKTRHEAKRHVRTKHFKDNDGIEVLYWRSLDEDGESR